MAALPHSASAPGPAPPSSADPAPVSGPVSGPVPGQRPLERVLLDLVRGLEQRGVPYAFLRGHEDFPRVRPDSDVDLVVPPSARADFNELLDQASRAHGARVLERFRAGFLEQHFLHAGGGGQHAFLSIDVHACEACFGVPFLGASDLIGSDRDARGLRVARPAARAWASFLAPLLEGGRTHRERADRLVELARSGDAEVPALGARLFGARAATELLEALAAGRPAPPGLRARLLRRRLARAPGSSLAGLAAFGWGLRARTLVRPRGRLVAFLGTDGSGKSTLAEAVLERLAPAFRSADSAVLHLRPGLLPQLDRVLHLGRTTQGPADWSRPHRARPSGRLGSNLRVAWYALDYLVGYAALILPRRRRRSLILFDRWFHDYLVDPRRFRVRPGTLLARAVLPLLPRPDRVLVVTAPTAVVQERKRELTPEESARQVRAYEELARSRGFRLVRNDGSLDDAVAAAVDAILEEAA